MPKEVQLNICKLFADDCKLYGTVLSDGENKFQKDLQYLERWSAKWQLPFNATKAKLCTSGLAIQNTPICSTTTFLKNQKTKRIWELQSTLN